MCKHQTITHPLKPLFQADSKILILGSFPSVKTREYGFFYGHPQNRFWPLLERIFNVKLSIDIEERRAFLLKHNIAVYDVIYQCDIIGSSDASIQNVIPSDLSRIFNEADIKKVFCNGGTSYRFYKKYQEKKTGFKAIQLPSTSPANARYSIDDLYSQWKIISKY
ncbi:MAG: DNA-deoxyinosine glycosylase [Erysipelotrichaceae bacterium]|jgi:hypoxanthine-DNA glycosylase|nr:DNA-deoxyinosine glycosylase [Bacillota bacterium]NLP22549.1 DNA-deoxyinosine glycosylase [Erysipelotrichaceae bacterium]HCY06907.1 DNA-deoxyinosine glycosylase [Erysipelotrichaceae bacterium]